MNIFNTFYCKFDAFTIFILLLIGYIIFFSLPQQSQQHVAVIEKESDQPNVSFLRLKLCLRKNNYNLILWVTCTGIMSVTALGRLQRSKQTEQIIENTVLFMLHRGKTPIFHGT